MDNRLTTYDELLAENADLKRRVAELEARVVLLMKQLDQLLKLLGEKNRSGKREAAPFSK